MSRCVVAEDEAGKERKRRHIGGYDAVFVTLPAVAASRSNAADQPENALLSRVETLVDGLEPGTIHVRVDLRRRDIGMAEHFLHYP